jgi:hypothetical protein
MSADFEVQVPGGGVLELKDEREVGFWNDTVEGYLRDYDIENQNDLAAIGSIATQSLFRYRAQVDAAKGEGDARQVQIRVEKAEEAIEKIEKRLGIDKRTRDKDSESDTATIVAVAKQACIAKGIRISDRVIAYEHFNNALKTKIRILRNGDAEDRREMGVSEKSIIDFAEKQLAEIEAHEQEWEKEQGAIVVGTL